MCQNCFRLKQAIWVKSPRDALPQQHEKVMEEMSLKQSLRSYEPRAPEQEGKSNFNRAAATSLEGELLCLQKLTKHQQEMSATMEKTLCSLIEQQKLSEMSHLEQKQEIVKLKAEVAELEQKNQALLKEKHQLIEVRLDTDSTNHITESPMLILILQEHTNLKQQVEVVNAKVYTYNSISRSITIHNITLILILTTMYYNNNNYYYPHRQRCIVRILRASVETGRRQSLRRSNIGARCSVSKNNFSKLKTYWYRMIEVVEFTIAL